MSKYLINKFLFTVDRDPDLVERYRADPVGTVSWWEAEVGGPDPELPGPGAQHVAGAHRRGAAGAAVARLCGAARARSA